MAAAVSGKVSATNSSAGMDVHEAARLYVTQKCIDSVAGIKALLLDDDTSACVGLVISHTKALNLQVYIIDKLDNPIRKPVGRINAVCIIRPTPENIRVLRKELSQPRFEEYHLFFTNTLPDHLLKDLAQADVAQVNIRLMNLSNRADDISAQYSA
jgi:vacuolar protein sorting-associated protein 45